MMLPCWIPFVVAAWVIAFGIMRLRIAFRKEPDADSPNYRKGGYYARSSRSHGFFGVAYLVLGGYCIAMGLGYQIDFLSGCLGDKTTTETRPAGDQTLPVVVE